MMAGAPITLRSGRANPPTKPCKKCGRQFGRRANEDLFRFHGRSYCSRICSDRRADLSVEAAVARFETQYIPEPNSGCWIWIGNQSRGGYGSFSFRGKACRAPRISYCFFCEDIPDGLIIRHTCDVKECVNPDHLIVGTYKENTADARERGQLLRGSRHANAKITEKDVLAIRLDKRTMREIARSYSLSPSAVCNIRNGKLWAHIPFPVKQEVSS